MRWPLGEACTDASHSWPAPAAAAAPRSPLEMPVRPLRRLALGTVALAAEPSPVAAEQPAAVAAAEPPEAAAARWRLWHRDKRAMHRDWRAVVQRGCWQGVQRAVALAADPAAAAAPRTNEPAVAAVVAARDRRVDWRPEIGPRLAARDRRVDCWRLAAAAVVVAYR